MYYICKTHVVHFNHVYTMHPKTHTHTHTHAHTHTNTQTQM